MKKNGYTLIEVLIASALFVVIMGAVVAIFGYSANLETRNSAISKASQTARFITESIARDVRLAESFTIDPSVPEITITDNNQNTFSYYWGSSGTSSDNDIIYYRDKTTNESIPLNNPEQVSIDNFALSGIDGTTLGTQSYLTIDIGAQARIGTKTLATQTQNIKTTVSTRAYNKGGQKITPQ